MAMGFAMEADRQVYTRNIRAVADGIHEYISLNSIVFPTNQIGNVFQRSAVPTLIPSLSPLSVVFCRCVKNYRAMTAVQFSTLSAPQFAVVDVKSARLCRRLVKICIGFPDSRNYDISHSVLRDSHNCPGVERMPNHEAEYIVYAKLLEFLKTLNQENSVVRILDVFGPTSRKHFDPGYFKRWVEKLQEAHQH
ncbi:hypothetical protein CLF_101251 [Clonorchis sinensis]|uniref:Uncharacterized protein n=1 Tax=Clonorchis sinensis TaxID=79923 RepID=G7Y5C4_CLOSI|nr:hypothetical protein CLF_101251 [Clonorchis sinensis]